MGEMRTSSMPKDKKFWTMMIWMKYADCAGRASAKRGIADVGFSQMSPRVSNRVDAMVDFQPQFVQETRVSLRDE